MLRTSGQKILDNGRQVYLQGFTLWTNDVFKDFMPITLERLQQIKAWGFNTVNIVAFWGYHIETDINQPGVYDESNLQRIDNVIQMAGQAGLYVMLTIRVGMGGVPPPEWQGWPTTQIMVDNPAVRQRFYNMWSMMIQRFNGYPNVVGYQWWMFPWHGRPWGGHVAEEVDIYYNTIVPNLISTTRAVTNKIIFFTPYKQGAIYLSYPSPPPNDKIYDTGEFSFIGPIGDGNVVYCFGFHGPRDSVNDDYVEYDKSPWDYSILELQLMLQPGLDFSDQYNVPMMVTEMGMRTYGHTPLTQDRIDCYDAKMALLEQYGWNWVYYMYSNQSGTGSGVLKEGTYEPFPIVDVLRAHITPTISSLSIILPTITGLLALSYL